MMNAESLIVVGVLTVCATCILMMFGLWKCLEAVNKVISPDNKRVFLKGIIISGIIFYFIIIGTFIYLFTINLFNGGL